MRNRVAQLVFGLLMGASSVSAHPADDDGPVATGPRVQIRAAFDRGDYQSALSIIETQLAKRPDDARLLYQAGCAAACLGDDEDAVAFLARAVDAGFVDYALLRVDPDLESIREHPVYQAIVEEADRVLEQWRSDPVKAWGDRFGLDEYRYEYDDKRRLWYATALDETSHAAMRGMIEREADYLIKTFFGSPPGYDVLVATPTAEDASALFSGKDRYGGVYEHGSRRLIARDIGSSLRHEFFHLVHFGHMQRMGRLQPIWIQEGWASLYEDCEFPAAGGVEIMPNHRHDVIYHLARADKLLPWRKLLNMSQPQFMADAGRTYAQSRSIFQYMHEMRLLEDWYKRYTAEIELDPGGGRAIEDVFASRLERVERDWRAWLLRKPPAPMHIELGEDGLGLLTEMRGSNDGVRITGVITGSEPDRAGLCTGDIIVAINDKPTRSLLELRAIVGRFRPNTWVEFLVRRGEDYQDIPVKLHPVKREPVKREPAPRH